MTSEYCRLSRLRVVLALGFVHVVRQLEQGLDGLMGTNEFMGRAVVFCVNKVQQRSRGVLVEEPVRDGTDIRLTRQTGLQVTLLS